MFFCSSLFRRWIIVVLWQDSRDCMYLFGVVADEPIVAFYVICGLWVTSISLNGTESNMKHENEKALFLQNGEKTV